MYIVVYTQKVAYTGQIITSGFINDAYNSDTPTPFHMQGLNVLAKSLQSWKMKTKPNFADPTTGYHQSHTESTVVANEGLEKARAYLNQVPQNRRLNVPSEGDKGNPSPQLLGQG